MTRDTKRSIAVALASVSFAAACAGPAKSPPQLERDQRSDAAAPSADELAPAINPPAAPRVIDGQRLPLANGLSCVALPGPDQDPSQIQFGVFAGSLFVAPGLAELAAYTLLHSTDPTTSTASLAQRIHDLGGSVAISVGLTATWFDIRVLKSQTEAALTALRDSLDYVTRSRTQIMRMREDFVAERTAEILADPLGCAAKALLQAGRSSADDLNALLDLDASEVTLFHSRLYRPERAILTVRSSIPVDRLNKLLVTGKRAMNEWAPKPSLPGDSLLSPRQFKSGLYWSDSLEPGADTRCALVMQMPDASMPNAAGWLIMHACLTLDGVGGRLEQLQAEAGLSHLEWRTRFEQTADVLALVMSTTGTPAEVAQLWQLYQRARQSLVAVPPSRSELQLALRRAKLNASLSTISATDRQRLDINMLLRNVPAGTLEQQIDQIAAAPSWDTGEVARAFQDTPAWMIAIGSGRPDAIDGLVATRVLPAGFDPITKNQPTAENLAIVDPRLERARAATGGDEAYRMLSGFYASASTSSEQGLVAEDTIEWRTEGSLERKRIILGQVITTSLTADAGTEELDGEQQPIDARGRRLLRHELMRHPQMLLAAHLRGESRFRPIAQRKVGDREHYIIEAVGGDFDRLRLHIDAESQLIRIVESWERLADETLVHVREEWGDYRNTGGMRVPHRRRTIWNDGQLQSETIYSEWLPR